VGSLDVWSRYEPRQRPWGHYRPSTGPIELYQPYHQIHVQDPQISSMLLYISLTPLYETLLKELTTKNNTDILRCHEVYSGMLSHSVQMKHKCAKRVVVILGQFIDRESHSCVLVGRAGDAYRSASNLCTWVSTYKQQ
jgi:hypothetical protein